MNFNLIIVGLLLILGVNVYSAQPVYYISFDKTIQANYGGTGVSSVTTVDSDQEAIGMKGVLSNKSGKVTYDKLLVPGMVGNAFASGKDNSGNIHSIFYKPIPAMNGKESTISFWIKPENWFGNDKEQHVFFTAAGAGTQRLLIYRIQYQSRLAVYLGPLGDNKAATVIFTKVPSWKPGQWHHISVSWNERAVQLHLDGVSKAMAALKTPITSDFHTIAIGEYFGGNPGRTLVDEVRIFDKKLPEHELVEEYNRLASKLPAATEPIKINVGKKTARQDGVISNNEYSFFTVGMRDLRSRALCVENMQTALSYDDKNLYVAFLSSGKGIKSSATGVDGKVWLDDSVEVLLNTGKSENEIYQFIFNSQGAYYDGKNDNTSWNAKGVKNFSRISNNLWIFEAAIPWADLGIKGSPDGKSLKINICRNTPVSRNSLAGVRSQYAEPEHFIPLFLDPKAPSFYLKSLGKPGDGKLDLRFEAISKSNVKLQIKVDAPAPLYAFEKDLTIDLKPNKKVSGKITGERLPENPLLKINVTADGKTIYRNTIPCGSSMPVVKSHLYTDIAKKTLILVFRNQRLDGGKCKVKVSFLSRDKKKKIYTFNGLIDDRMPIAEVKVPINSLAPGDYHIEQIVLDPQGKELFTVNEIYMTPAKLGSWVGTKVGISNEVPPPWNPVKNNNGSFSCWGRTYKFGGQGVISSIKSVNRELLTRPVIIKFDNKSLKFNIIQTIEKADNVTYLLQSEDKSVLIKAVAEYDGVIWFTVTLPKGRKKPASLVLELPLNRKYVDSFDDNDNCWEKISLVNKEKFNFYVNAVTNPFFWCGGNDVGISGGTHTHRGRYIKDKRKSMNVIGNKNEVLISLNLVDSKINNTAERNIYFYLQPTPTKPLNSKVWNLKDRINHMVVFNVPRYFNTMRPGQLDDLKKWSYHYRMIIKPYTAKDVTFQYYFAPKGAGAYSAEWNYFGNLWHNAPPMIGNYAGKTNDFAKKPKAWTYGCLNSRNYFDFQIDSVAHYLNNPYVDVKDLYFDLSWPRSCGNKLHGCVWIDEFGYEHHDNDLLPLREFYRRVWHMIRKKNPNTFFLGHLISTRTPADSYFDVIAAGEMYEDKLLKNGKISYYNVLNPELMRIAYGTRTNEATVALIGQFSQAVGRFMPDKLKGFSFDDPHVDKAARHFLTYELVCGLSPYYYCGKTRPKEIYDVFDQLGPARPKFYPWWSENPAVKADNGALAALYASKHNALLTVLNDSDKAVTVVLNIRKDLRLDNKAVKAVFTKKNYHIQGNFLRISLAPREGELLFVKR